MNYRHKVLVLILKTTSLKKKTFTIHMNIHKNKITM